MSNKLSNKNIFIGVLRLIIARMAAMHFLFKREENNYKLRLMVTWDGGKKLARKLTFKHNWFTILICRKKRKDSSG
jgi:hypothetical protein